MDSDLRPGYDLEQLEYFILNKFLRCLGTRLTSSKVPNPPGRATNALALFSISVFLSCMVWTTIVIILISFYFSTGILQYLRHTCDPSSCKANPRNALDRQWMLQLQMKVDGYILPSSSLVIPKFARAVCKRVSSIAKGDIPVNENRDSCGQYPQFRNVLKIETAVPMTGAPASKAEPETAPMRPPFPPP